MEFGWEDSVGLMTYMCLTRIDEWIGIIKIIQLRTYIKNFLQDTHQIITVEDVSNDSQLRLILPYEENDCVIVKIIYSYLLI